MFRSFTRSVTLGLAALGAMTTAAAHAEDTKAVRDAQGLWAYTLLKAGRSGEEMPLTGIILYKDGLFAQQSIFNGEPFETKGAMAHAGTFGPGPRGIHMIAEQTIGIDPAKQPALSFRKDTQHDISVTRDGTELTLVFGSGTIQKFRQIGPADGEIYKLEQGVLALVDGHFVLVSGDEKGVVTGYGKAIKQGDGYMLEIIRWSEATPAKAVNRKDGTIKANFDGKTFTLADGRSFKVVPKG
ncbi:hypothetical protein [Rhizorhabdus sp.]|jgi:hypothetical protein|uniref:hypothetical protein n=1 Tax=Rhizorhabdus sp. TaxID=1968843 RepID=UPI001B4A9915|nr:hypothetical protein [Rhizorhabdus sp.]MBP8233917.1 hypothetical protein [Rhizorhabdus sp.]